jgi:uncharacterized protein YkwD
MVHVTRRFLTLFLIPLVAALAATLAPAAPAQAMSVVNGVRLNASEAALLSYINNARRAAKLSPVTITPGTTDVARRWSKSMSAARTMKHNPNFAKQVAAAGSPRWTRITENVGYASANNAKQLFDAYMASPGHRANILDRKVRYVGIGSVDRPDPAWPKWILYNTMNFTDYYSSSYGASKVAPYKLRIDK